MLIGSSCITAMFSFNEYVDLCFSKPQSGAIMVCTANSCAVCLVLCLVFRVTFAAELNPVFAINCGGDAHVDSNGVWYAADFNNRGIASGHGLNLVMHRAHESDAVLYQTERYDTSSFYYEFPLPADGQYVLHLKFSEVWFQHPNGKVFSVELNGGLRIIKDLDIFQKVGFSVAHDENIPFTIRDGSIVVGDAIVKLSSDEKLRITFVKGSHDNPKVNAIALFKNSIEDIPKLPPQDFLEEEDSFHPQVSLPPSTLSHLQESGAENDEDSSWRSRRLPMPSSLEKPPAPDPYASADYSVYVLPILIAVATFLPLIFCLYRF
ncbi:Malectin [Echinococcus granulosus]|nr:Malectin [Echinococcus granulosus]